MRSQSVYSPTFQSWLLSCAYGNETDTVVLTVFAGIPGSEVLCIDPVRVLGCNMVGHHCKCSEVPVCPGEEAPFSFTSREECEMNLAVMLAHEQSDAPPQGRLQVTDCIH